MTCPTCFYSQESYTQEPISGRSKEGVEVWTEGCDVLMSSVVCHAEPKPLFISMHNGSDFRTDVMAEPEYHRCGRGRWWDSSGKWVRWIDGEEE